VADLKKFKKQIKRGSFGSGLPTHIDRISGRIDTVYLGQVLVQEAGLDTFGGGMAEASRRCVRGEVGPASLRIAGAR